ncbi:MAG: Uma2 family endonuclease [Nitrospirae bacterium]|nr:Uma2 family endonuclease [Nitrospirota bacterium]
MLSLLSFLSLSVIPACPESSLKSLGVLFPAACGVTDGSFPYVDTPLLAAGSFIRKENAGIAQDWIRGVPDMVCEIISPGSYEMDTAVKRAIYERYRVPEYWIILPEFMTVEILTIEGGKYKLHSFAALEGVVTSKVIEGLEINVKDIFE